MNLVKESDKAERPSVAAQPWTQPLFMIYDAGRDEAVPLTQARLDELIQAERQYGTMICAIRDSHHAYAERLGYSAKPFAPVRVK